MSINSCAINEHTLNTLCGRRRAAIIAELLHPVVVQVVKPHQQHVHSDTRAPLNVFRRDSRQEREEIDFSTLELPYIQVTIEMMGKTYQQTIERDNAVPMVNAYGLTMKDVVDQQINISDINIRILE